MSALEVYGFHGQKARFESRKLLDAAAEGVCQNCGRDDGSIVAAHANEARLGKGKWMKAHDCFHAHLCSQCHGYIDRVRRRDTTGVFGDTPEDRRECFIRAMHRTWLWLFIVGKIKAVA